jgi:hypothetical protein
VELHRLPVDAAMQAEPVSVGWSRALTCGPRSLSEVLGAALEQMNAEDEAEAYRADPIAYITAQRSKRTLWGRLFGRR